MSLKGKSWHLIRFPQHCGVFLSACFIFFLVCVCLHVCAAMYLTNEGGAVWPSGKGLVNFWEIAPSIFQNGILSVFVQKLGQLQNVTTWKRFCNYSFLLLHTICMEANCMEAS